MSAIRVLMDRYHRRSAAAEDQTGSRSQLTNESTYSTSRGFLRALLTILVADVTMSLDNVLAVGALAHGNLLVLSIGSLVSIVILPIGSALIAELMTWLPLLLDAAALR